MQSTNKGGQLQRFREPKEGVFFWVVLLSYTLDFFCASSYSIFLTAKLLFQDFFLAINTLMDVDNED